MEKEDSGWLCEAQRASEGERCRVASGIGVPTPSDWLSCPLVAGLLPRLRCPQSPLASQAPESRLECEPLQVFRHQWMQGRLPSLTRPEVLVVS